MPHPGLHFETSGIRHHDPSAATQRYPPWSDVLTQTQSQPPIYESAGSIGGAPYQRQSAFVDFGPPPQQRLPIQANESFPSHIKQMLHLNHSNMKLLIQLVAIPDNLVSTPCLIIVLLLHLWKALKISLLPASRRSGHPQSRRVPSDHLVFSLDLPIGRIL